MTKKLGLGDTFPNISLKLVGGGTIDLPSRLGSKYGAIVFYRGHW